MASGNASFPLRPEPVDMVHSTLRNAPAVTQPPNFGPVPQPNMSPSFGPVVLKFRVLEPEVGIDSRDVEAKEIIPKSPIFLVEPSESLEGNFFQRAIQPLSLQQINKVLLSYDITDAKKREYLNENGWRGALAKGVQTPREFFSNHFFYAGCALSSSDLAHMYGQNKWMSSQRGGPLTGVPDYWPTAHIGQRVGFRLGWLDELSRIQDADFIKGIRESAYKTWFEVKDITQREAVHNAEIAKRRVIIPVVGDPVQFSFFQDRQKTKEQDLWKTPFIDRYNEAADEVELGDYICVGSIENRIGKVPTEAEIFAALFNHQAEINLHRRSTVDINLESNPTISHFPGLNRLAHDDDDVELFMQLENFSQRDSHKKTVFD